MTFISLIASLDTTDVCDVLPVSFFSLVASLDPTGELAVTDADVPGSRDDEPDGLVLASRVTLDECLLCFGLDEIFVTVFLVIIISSPDPHIILSKPVNNGY